MLEVMDCFFCGKYYQANEFKEVRIKLPYAEVSNGEKPANKSIEVPVCKTCFHILESGEAMEIHQSEDESLEDRVREIVHEEIEAN